MVLSESCQRVLARGMLILCHFGGRGGSAAARCPSRVSRYWCRRCRWMDCVRDREVRCPFDLPMYQILLGEREADSGEVC